MKLQLFVLAGALAVLSAPAAQAGPPPPPNFPDFDGFTVETDAHLVPYQRTAQEVVKFSTPDGLSCGIDALGGVAPAVRCYGPVPGMTGLPVVADATSTSSCDFGVAQLHSANPGVINSHRGVCPTDLAGAALLAPGQKVSMGPVTCGVAAGGITACLDNTDGGHGFVLQPSGSWTF
ncbi:MAG: hypothetical protein P4L86_27390 [Mycobacterium sp.]|nr:hypothetical protein [Mycobacterium sp.]